MQFCTTCQRTIDDFSATLVDAAVCPYCRTKLPRAETADRISVARVANLAEAGFLANDLTVHGIDARILASENFSALAGRWTSSYYIQVPQSEGPAATEMIRAHLAEDSVSDDTDYLTNGACATEGAVDQVLWRPVALMVLAGMASFVLGQRFAEDRPPQPKPVLRDSLPAAVAAIGRPLVAEPRGGRAGHRLWYERHHHCWYLETDSDGDGRYEQRQRFQPTGMRW